MTIPRQLYVTLKQELEYDPLEEKTVNRVYPLGFAHPYAPGTAAFEKKRQTQLAWAYGAYSRYEERPDGIWLGERHVWEHVNGKHISVTRPPERVEDHLQPRIVDNAPIAGFYIHHTVSRMSTSNKLWRIVDPRGFELEISTSNMFELLIKGGVHKGVIQGTCVWHTGKLLKYA